MATYKGINGYAVQTVASDPSPGDPGQVFYNTTSKAFEYTTEVQGSWASGGALGTPRFSFAGAGTQTAGLAFGSGPSDNLTEEYDGTSWTAGGNLNTARYSGAGSGTQTAALFAGGYGSDQTTSKFLTELYDGTAWTNGGKLNVGRGELTGAGTQASGIVFAGEPVTTSTEEFTGGNATITLTAS